MTTDSKLFCPSDDSLVWRDAPANRGWDRSLILDLLAGDDPPLNHEGSPAMPSLLAFWGDCEVVDGSLLSEEERQELYTSALLARPRHEVKSIFRPEYLGTLIPALFIYDDQALEWVYPRDVRHLGIITIRDYLTKGTMTEQGDANDVFVYDPWEDT